MNVPVTGVFTALKMCIYPLVYIWGVLVPPRCRLERRIGVLSLKIRNVKSGELRVKSVP